MEQYSRDSSMNEIIKITLGDELYSYYKKGEGPGLQHVISNLLCVMQMSADEESPKINEEEVAAHRLLIRYARLLRENPKLKEYHLRENPFKPEAENLSIEHYIEQEEQKLKKARTSS